MTNDNIFSKLSGIHIRDYQFQQFIHKYRFAAHEMNLLAISSAFQSKVSY